MRADREAAAELEDRPVPVPLKLAAAWSSLLFLYVYVDLLGFYLPGVIDDILAGIVWEFAITQAWATGALALMAVPIAMVVLATMLPARANRASNLLVASIYAVVSVGNAVGEAWTYYYGLAVGLELAALAVIVRLAWTWPRTTAPVASEPPGGRHLLGVRPDGHGDGRTDGRTLTGPTTGA